MEDQRPVHRQGLRVGRRRTRSRRSSATRRRRCRGPTCRSTARIAPGPKSFDFDINQISYTPARAKVVDFSKSYYDVNQAIVVNKGTKIASVRSIKGLASYKLGAQLGTTSYAFIKSRIKPSQQPAVYNSNAAAVLVAEEQADRRSRRRPADGVLRDRPCRCRTARSSASSRTRSGDDDRPLRRRAREGEPADGVREHGRSRRCAPTARSSGFSSCGWRRRPARRS